jgi:hypothetical protein
MAWCSCVSLTFLLPPTLSVRCTLIYGYDNQSSLSESGLHTTYKAALVKMMKKMMVKMMTRMTKKMLVMKRVWGFRDSKMWLRMHQKELPKEQIVNI